MTQPIDPQLLDCTVYLYYTKAQAEAGVRSGGTGFLVSVVHEPPGEVLSQLYVVTNAHVVKGKNVDSVVIRINKTEDIFECIETRSKNWIEHQDGDDIAIYPIDLMIDRHKFVHLDVDQGGFFVTRESVARWGFSPGDETFMVGRFINHEGKQRNRPSVRFGSISMMADEREEEKIRPSGNGKPQEAFLVECRSIPGYSGSPVFVWRPAPLGKVYAVGGERHGPWLLGIDCGHIPYESPVYKRAKVGSRLRPQATDYFSESLSGMAVVIPAWRIYKLLKSERLIKMRAKETERYRKAIEEESPHAF